MRDFSALAIVGANAGELVSAVTSPVGRDRFIHNIAAIVNNTALNIATKIQRERRGGGAGRGFSTGDFDLRFDTSRDTTAD